MKTFALIGLMLLMNTAYALDLSAVSTSPAEIGSDEKFLINAFLSGDSCLAEVRFYLDDDKVSSKVPGCGRISIESNPIDPSKYNMECGVHAIRVELFNNGALSANTSKEIMIGNQPLITMPEKAEPETQVVIGFIDRRTGEGIEDLEIDIKNPDDAVRNYKTDPAGDIKASFSDAGTYILSIDDSDYCGTKTFEVRESLDIEGPTPAAPYAGESIMITTSPNVVIKAINEEGKVMAAGVTNADGMINLTINDAGAYTITIAEASQRYWSENISLIIAGKENAEIRVSPEKPARGSEVIVQVLFEGKPVPKIALTIEEPDNETYAYEADNNGTVKFTPTKAGAFIAGFDDIRFNKTEKEFTVKAQLTLDIIPKSPRTEQDITVYVKDDSQNPVTGAAVSVGGVFYGFSGSDAGVTFKLNSPGRYQATSSKEGFWDAALDFSVIAPLELEIMPSEPEYGEKVMIKATDVNGNEVAADIRVIRPDGVEEAYSGEYITKAVGKHRVSAENEGYVPTEAEFSVKPMPLELHMALIKDRLLINTSSRGRIAPNITLVIEKASGTDTIKTDASGKAEVLIKKDERIKVSANAANESPIYGRITVVRNIVKRYDPSSLIFALSAIAVVAIVGIIIVYMVPKIEGRRQFDSYLEKKTHGKGRQSGQDVYKSYHEPYFKKEKKSKLSGK